MGKIAKQSKSRKDIGLRIKYIRKKDGINAGDFADAFKVSRATWSLYENGKSAFDSDDILHIAKFLGVDPGWLLTGNSESISPPTKVGGDGLESTTAVNTAILCFRVAEMLSRWGRGFLGDKPVNATAADLDVLTKHLQDITELAETVEMRGIHRDPGA